MLGRLDVSVGNASVCPSGRLDFLVEKAPVAPSGRLDNREHGLRPLLQESDFPTALLPVADIWIGVDADGAPAPNGLLIERKSAADLEASILDGRYREQRSRLMNYATERRAHPVYIIEGSLNGHKRLAAPALMKHITRLAIRYHIAVFQVPSMNDTAALILLLTDQWRSDPTTFEQPATMTYVETQGRGAALTKQENSENPRVFAVTVLRACPGISAQIAEKVLEGCGGSLEGVWTASVAELTTIQCGKVRLGPVRAERLWRLLHALPSPTAPPTDLIEHLPGAASPPLRMQGAAAHAAPAVIRPLARKAQQSADWERPRFE